LSFGSSHIAQKEEVLCPEVMGKTGGHFASPKTLKGFEGILKKWGK